MTYTPNICTEYVDLGLPSGLKWATCNVGASTPSDYGRYFAWGEVSPKSEYTGKNSKTYNEKIDDFSGNPEYDAARHNWGGSWRMPTKSEWQELYYNCRWEMTTYDGKKGYKVSGSNGNSIFLPTAGYRHYSSLFDDGSYGFYWSSSPYVSDLKYAYCMYFDNGFRDFGLNLRYYGFSIRPVAE